MGLSEQTQDPEEFGIVQYVGGTQEDGQAFWAYILMKPERYEEYYSQVMTGEKLDLTDYGDILQQGFGAQPPAEIQQQITEKYGMSKEVEAQLTALGNEAIVLYNEDNN